MTFICLLNFGINAEVGNRTAYNSFTSAMQYPIKLLEDRYSKLDLEGRPVTVLPYANEEDCKIITDALKKLTLTTVMSIDQSLNSKTCLSFLSL